jgi:hypothetical protein
VSHGSLAYLASSYFSFLVYEKRKNIPKTKLNTASTAFSLVYVKYPLCVGYFYYSNCVCFIKIFNNSVEMLFPSDNPQTFHFSECPLNCNQPCS